MATVKITDLPYITSLQSNTANTVLVGVDIPSDDTGQITLTTLATGLYSNNNLKVGNNDVLFANAIGQFHGTAAPYLQVAVHNADANGSGDLVVTADTGTDTTYYVDLGIQGSNLSQGILASLDSYLLSVGDTSTSPGGNLIIGTDTPNKNVDIVLGGHETNNLVAQFLYGQGFKLTQKPIIFADGTSQNSAVAYTGVDSRITSNVNTLNASITANAASANAVINSHISSNISTANLFTQAAFDKANNALANSSVIHTAGDFYMSGDGYVNGTFILANSTFGATESAFTIKATATVQTPSQAGTMMHVTGKANTPARIIYDSFSTDGSAYVVMAGRTGRGSVVSPTATQNNDILMRVAGNGWGTTGFAPLGVARIDIVATENYTDSARGSKIVMYNIANGSNAVQEIASFNANTIHFSGTVNPEKGFSYTPNNITSNATSYTIDFSRDSMVRMSCNDNMSITLTGYQTGKIVEVWITNGANQNKTITHGCLANNSTEQSTTFTILANSCAFLKYFSIDGDNQNTFVSITA